MAARSFQRGWSIIYVGYQWVYEDTGEPAEVERSCRRCDRMPMPEGYDACLGYVPGAISVCCGHGVEAPYEIISEAGMIVDAWTTTQTEDKLIFHIDHAWLSEWPMINAPGQQVPLPPDCFVEISRDGIEFTRKIRR